MRGKTWRLGRLIESLVGSAFDLLQYLAFPVSLTQLKCVALLALKRHPPLYEYCAMPNLCWKRGLSRLHLGRLVSVFLLFRFCCFKGQLHVTQRAEL